MSVCVCLVLTTNRDEICACSEEAYESLSLQEAQKIMRFDTKAALLEMAKEQEWVVENGRVYFKSEPSADNLELNSMELIKNTLHYAKEIERIV